MKLFKSWALSMGVILAVILFIPLTLALILGVVAFDAWIVTMNVNDMIAQGHASFWPIFWIVLVLGGAGSVIGSLLGNKKSSSS